MKNIIIQLKKDYKYGNYDFKMGTYIFNKERNMILIEKVKEITFKNEYLKIKYKNAEIHNYVAEANIPFEAIENYVIN